MTFRSTLQPDDPIVQDARFRLDATDRAYIDEQTRACEFFIAECLLNGIHATYGTLAGSSATIAVGDVLCLSNAGTGTLTLANAAAIAVAGRAAGVALEVAAPGAKVRYALGGILSPTVTGLGAVAGAARVSAAGRLERVAALAPGDYGVGSIDATGMLTMVAFADAGGAVPTSLTLTTTAPLRIDGGASADLSANRTFSISLGSAGQIIVMNAGATAWAAVSMSGDATLAGTGAITVAKVNGASVPVAGALTTGNVLQVSGASALSYGAVNLAGGAGYVTGVLPIANTDATATPTASKIPLWTASVHLGATRFFGSGTVAGAGVLATANNVVAVAARSSGGTDISLLTTDGSDKLTVGDASDASALDLVSAGAARVLVGAFLAWHANDRGVSFLIAPSFGGGEGVIGIGNATTAPTTAPTGGVVAYSDSAALKVWTPNKVRSTLAPEGNAAHTDQRLDELWRTVTTADATITTIGTYTLPAACCAVLRCVVTGQQTGTDATCVYTFDVTFRRAAGIAASTTGAVTTIIDAIGVAAVPSCDTDGANDGRVRVTGKAATDIDWALSVTHLHLYSV